MYFRSYDSTMTSNLDDLDDLEESRVDDNVSCGFFDEYFTDLSSFRIC